MDAIEFFLMFLVALSVIVFLIVDRHHPIEPNSNYCRENSSSREEVEDRLGQNTDEVEKGEIPENFDFRCEESGDCSGLTSVSGNSVDCGDFRNKDDEEGFIDDWEGIERTELERLFGKAVVFVSEISGDQIAEFDLQLYGLQKIALEGPCHESQPMALNISARSKWNAWQKLGNMSRETAMEQYIDILSKTIPHWTGADKASSQDQEATSTQQKQCEVETER